MYLHDPILHHFCDIDGYSIRSVYGFVNPTPQIIRGRVSIEVVLKIDRDAFKESILSNEVAKHAKN